MTETEKIFEKINKMAVDIGQIKTTLKMLPSPPKQPCQWHLQLRKEFDDHINEHKKITDNWRNSLIKASVDIFKTAIIAGVGLLVGLVIGGGI